MAPLTIEASVSLLALSTINRKPSHYFNRLINCNKFRVIRVAYVCDVCRAKGFKKECRHRLDSKPWWVDGAKLSEIESILGADNADKLELENLGLDPEDDELEVFPSKLVLELFNKPRVVLTRPIRVVYISIDPCAGSIKPEDKEPSDMAVIVIGQPGNVILGQNGWRVGRTEAYRDRLVNMLNKIMSHPMVEGATIVVDVERGTGLVAGDAQAIIQNNFQHVCVMNDYDEDNPGRITNYDVKHEMAQLTRAWLAVNDVGFWENLSCDDSVKTSAKLKDQLLKFKRNVKEGKGMNSDTVIYSGKGKNKDDKDDLSVTLQKCVLAMKDFAGQRKYARWHR